MKKLFLLFISLIFFTGNIQAQSFVCTDLNYYSSDMTSSKVQKERNRWLGAKAVLTFYDNSMRIQWTDNNGRTESFILSKLNEDEYYSSEKYGNDTMTVRVKLQKWVAYIKSFTVNSYRNQTQIGNATFKRK